MTAGSCNYDFNPTINVPEGYFDDISQYSGTSLSNYYFDKYNQLLDKNFISKMDASGSVKEELCKLSNAVENTKNLAMHSSEGFDYGSKYLGVKETEYSFMETWSVTNCGEV